MKVSRETYDKLKELRRSIIDENGMEVPNPVPMAIPTGFRKPESLTEQIKRIMRVELSNQALNQGYESFEEADDFFVEDEDLENYDTSYTMQDEYPIMDTNPKDAESGGTGSAGNNPVKPEVDPENPPENLEK